MLQYQQCWHDVDVQIMHGAARHTNTHPLFILQQNCRRLFSPCKIAMYHVPRLSPWNCWCNSQGNQPLAVQCITAFNKCQWDVNPWSSEHLAALPMLFLMVAEWYCSITYRKHKTHCFIFIIRNTDKIKNTNKTSDKIFHLKYLKHFWLNCNIRMKNIFLSHFTIEYQ